MTWDKGVPGCFGERDLIFAIHPMDEQRAFEWLTDLRKRSMGWKAARQQLKDFLESKDASQVHIDEQLKKAMVKLEPWLLD